MNPAKPSSPTPAGGDAPGTEETPAPQQGPDAPSAAGEEDPGAALDDTASPDQPAPGVTPVDPVEVERRRQAKTG